VFVVAIFIATLSWVTANAAEHKSEHSINVSCRWYSR